MSDLKRGQRVIENKLPHRVGEIVFTGRDERVWVMFDDENDAIPVGPDDIDPCEIPATPAGLSMPLRWEGDDG